MTEDEKKINDVENRVSNLETKFEMFMQESRDMRQEMRDRDNQRAAEIRELRQKQDSDMREIRQDMKTMQARIEDIGKHVRNLAWTGMAAVGGMFVAVGAMVATVIYTIFKS